MFQTDFTIEEFKSRRERVAEEIGEGAIALLVGAGDSASMGAFRQYNEFYYLCGVEVPHSYLVINGGSGKSTLFLPRETLQNKDHQSRLLSADDPDYAQETTGVDAVCGIEDLGSRLAGAGTIYALLREGQGEMATSGTISGRRRAILADPWDGRPDRGTHQINLIQTRCPGAEIRDLDGILRTMRCIKSPAEIELCRRAGELSARGLCDAVRATKPGVMEYQLDAILRYHYVAGGARGRGYSAIVAGGENTFYGHYMRNSSVFKDGDLVLLDCAPDYRYYTSDITRMWPVGGTYSREQRAIYGFVIEYHKTLVAATKAGRTLEEIRVESSEIMKGKIGDFQFASGTHEAAARRMFDSHAHLSHTVGMCVHDGGGHKGPPLVPGIVFSIDPQFVLPEEKMYVRSEDTGVVTEDGFEVFTKEAPLELDDIEAMMKEDSLLERFPPVHG